MGSAGRSHSAYIRATKQLRAEAPSICCYCNEHIDQTLHHNHPKAWTADHIVALVDCEAQGIDPNDISNLRPAHRGCNSSAGAKLRQERERGMTFDDDINVVRSRIWH